MNEIVGGGLIGDEIRLDATGLGALHQLGQDVRGIAQ